MKDLYGSVTLPASKSESNRALMVAAYGGFHPTIDNLSDAHDTLLLQALLARIESHEGEELLELDCEDAGTAARFLLTFVAARPGTWRLTGTERMCQRPMQALVDALRTLGADIICERREGFLPMRVKGKPLKGGALTIDGSRSSQFVSSLMLAAPMWQEGLELHYQGEVVSQPYIHLTVEVMRHFGAKVAATAHGVKVSPSPYTPALFKVGGDWTSASYWYEMASISHRSELVLNGLDWDSPQGDKMARDYFALMGVASQRLEHGVRLVKKEGVRANTAQAPLVFDFTHCPDLFPAVFVACVANNCPSLCGGVQNLVWKESNRVDAILAELSKCYTLLYNRTSDKVELIQSCIYLDKINDNEVIFNTFSDHRIALALSALALEFGKVRFDQPQVVKKSYPNYWNDFQLITECNILI